MNWRLARSAAIFVPSVMILALAGGCARLIPPSAIPVNPAASQASAVPTGTSVATVEVNNYKGQRLDKVASEPENSIKGPQHVDTKTYRLQIVGQVKTPLSLTYDEVIAMPAFEKVTRLNCIEGWTVTYLWRGVRLKDLLDRASYSQSANTVVFRCFDGYSTSLPLDYIITNNILLAYGMNNIVMPPERGYPFQVVAESRYGYKWAKWVTSIEVSDNASFKGYWEQRGYSNSAVIPGQ